MLIRLRNVEMGGIAVDIGFNGSLLFKRGACHIKLEIACVINKLALASAIASGKKITGSKHGGEQANEEKYRC